jgi:undecaprenol kinase/diacylglycerol kinase (ATP)
MRKNFKLIFSALLSVIIGFIGVSRIYLGVHYASDVIAGFLLSIAYLILFTHFVSNYLKGSDFMSKPIKKNKRQLINSFKYAINGIKESFKSERNFLIHFFVMILVILLGILLKITFYEWLICILLFGLVLFAEMINTAIEELTDLVMPQLHSKAKRAKDIAAGGVLILSITSAIVGLIIFVPKIYHLFF